MFKAPILSGHRMLQGPVLLASTAAAWLDSCGFSGPGKEGLGVQGFRA